MELEIINNDKKNNEVCFLLKDTNPSYANALRRIILAEVPTMAIEDVEMKKNNSILYDEIIAHRLGLIPLTTDLTSYEIQKEGDAPSAKNQLKIVLKEKGPKIVKASDLQSDDPKIKPVYPEMPIVKLLKGQELELDAKAMLGVGKTHMKWSPGHIFYKYKPKIEIKRQPKDVKSYIESCPKNLFNEKSSKLELNSAKNVECDMYEACIDVEPGVIDVSYDDTQFIFTLESWGQLAHKEILAKALEVFNDKLDELSAKIKG